MVGVKRWYNEAVKETRSTLKTLGFNHGKIPFVPISGLNGDNILVARDSADSLWYHGWEKCVNGITEYPGKTLLEATDDMNSPSASPSKASTTSQTSTR